MSPHGGGRWFCGASQPASMSSTWSHSRPRIRQAPMAGMSCFSTAQVRPSTVLSLLIFLRSRPCSSQLRSTSATVSSALPMGVPSLILRRASSSLSLASAFSLAVTLMRLRPSLAVGSARPRCTAAPALPPRHARRPCSSRGLTVQQPASPGQFHIGRHHYRNCLPQSAPHRRQIVLIWIVKAATEPIPRSRMAARRGSVNLTALRREP